MRLLKDSNAFRNPRALFWAMQEGARRSNRLQPFSRIRFLYKIEERGRAIYYAYWKHYRVLHEGLSIYIPFAKKATEWPVAICFLLGYTIGSFANNCEKKQWKENKWFEEPGSMIPIRKGLMLRLWNYLIEIKFKPTLYYFGLFVEDEDLNTHVEVQQFGEGRKFRRYLIQEFIRREQLAKLRDDRYDFLEISPKHGKEL
jgi:hypothetical protein